MSGLHSILTKLAEDYKKQAFVPMPGGEAQMDPAMAQGGGMPMDPSMGGMDPAMMGAQGGMPMDPSMGGMDPAMMAAVSGQAGIPEMMAAQGAPVDPAMAMAGGAPLPEGMMPGAGAAPEGAMPEDPAISGEAKATKKNEKEVLNERLANMEAMLNTLMGVLLGKGMVEQSKVPVANSIDTEASPESILDQVGAPSEQVGEPAPPKMASEKKDNGNEKEAAINGTARYFADILHRVRASK